MFTWTKDLALDIEQIDDQHKKLINITNQFLNSLKSGIELEEVVKLILFMEKFMKLHFQCEEIYMNHFEYPEREFHFAEHEYFADYVIDLGKTIRKEGIPRDTVLELRKFIVHWMRNHFMISDVKFSRFLKERLINKNKKILIVGLSDSEYEIMKHQLLALGYSSIHGPSDEATTEFIKLKKPLMIIVDTELDDDYILDLIKDIKEDEETKDIKIILLAALGKMEYFNRFKSLEIKDHLIKPVRITHLQNLIAKMVK